MNSMQLKKKLRKLGYTLTREHAGWLVRSDKLGYSWSFGNLRDVHTFMIDEENMLKMVIR